MAIIGGRAHSIGMIDEVCKLGNQYAEISLYNPEEITTQLDDLLKLKETYGIYYLAHYPNEDNPFDTKVLKNIFAPKMKRLFELSHDLGIEKATIHFLVDKRWLKPSIISEKIEILQDLVAYANLNGIQLCIENLTERYDSFSTVFDVVSDLMMTMDIGHGELLSKENTSFGFMQHLFDRIAHVHVHDNFGGKTVKDDLHLALGEGQIDYPGILSILQEKAYNSTITMEVRPEDMIRTRNLIEQYIW